MITNENELKNALRLLAASMPQQAPLSVEQKLLAQFRRGHFRRRMVWAASFAGAAIAAGVAAAVLMAPPMPGPPAPVMVHAAPPPVAQPETQVVVRQVRKKPPVARTSRAAEVATTFYALPDADSLAPMEDATVIRVRLPRSAMRMVGLPVNEERLSEHIQADVVFGQDGLMRAVRFVQ